MASPLVKVRIVCVSDTHNASPGEGYTLPAGDVLVHAGDLTNQGSLAEVRKAVDWISRADFAVKIVVAGNHDLSLDENYSLKHSEGWTVMPQDGEEARKLLADHPGIIYLQHTRCDLPIVAKNVTLRVFGSPYSEESKAQNWAFQYSADAAVSLWSEIAPDIDVLITHTPPNGYCDESRHWQGGGCPALAQRIAQIRPLLHICGHCHESRGGQVVKWESQTQLGPLDSPLVELWKDTSLASKKQSLYDLTGKSGHKLQAGNETAIVNASIMARSFGKGAKQFNKPIVIDVLLPSSGT